MSRGLGDVYNRQAMDDAKRMEKDGLSEDNRKSLEDDIQKVVESFNSTIEKRVSLKEADIMKV